jgi:dTDP-glucose 4,6-dehydratase
MDILVAGGIGFISTNFIQLILDKYPNNNVVCIDATADIGYKRNLDLFSDNSRFYFYQIDASNYDELLKLFKFWYGFDMIVHFVSEKDSHVMSVYNFLEIIKKYKTKKYLQTSVESRRSSKKRMSVDLTALSYFSSFELPIVILKYSNNYGSFQHPREFIPSIITNVLESERTIIHQDLYSGINVLDHCRGLETLMHYGKPGELYYLGSDECIKSIDIGKFILNYLDISSDLIEEARDSSEQKINQVYTGYEKLNKEYGWVPVIDFKTGLADTIEWYKSNISWWKFLKTYI